MIKPSLVLLSLCLSTLVSADPIVLLDTGRTVDATKYLAEKEAPTPKQKPSITGFVSPKTPEMTLGRVNKRSVSLPYLPSPLFLVGADSTSIQWLSKHRQALIKAGAVGLIVNAANAHEVQKVMQAAGGLQISPASGSDLAKQFQLNHYPVLITRTQIAQ